jgi:hypothetical protein
MNVKLYRVVKVAVKVGCLIKVKLWGSVSPE